MTQETAETPAAEESLITWKPNGVESGECGFVGRIQEWLVQIWRPGETSAYELILNLPGKTVLYGKRDDTMDDMKKQAERQVRWFIDDITGKPARGG